MKPLLNALLLVCLSVFLAACVDGEGCQLLKCKKDDAACRQPLKKIKYTPKNGTGTQQELGITSYIVTIVQEVVQGSSEKVYDRIAKDRGYKNLVTTVMLMFVAFYGIAIALGLMQPNPMDLVIRIAKMAIVYYLLTGWGNFDEIVVKFFEDLTNGLTSIITSAIIDSASNTTGSKVGAMDVFNFIDEKVLGVILSVRFATIMGAIMTISPVGLIIGALLVSIVLGYLSNLVSAIQIYIMAFIARALLYAVAPIFLIFLMFQQTKSLFDSWIKQLVNFALQPVLLIAFMAFFNGIFFNYLEVMFKDAPNGSPPFRVCYGADKGTSGQTIRLNSFKIVTTDRINYVENYGLVDVLDIFTVFVVVMLGSIMLKMNGWAVQAAAHLSEGGISFAQTAQSNNLLGKNATRAFGQTMRDAAGLTNKPK